MKRIVYGIDFGGTNLRIGKVDAETGRIIGNVFKRSLDDVSTNDKLNDIIFSNIPKGSNVGICAAGDIDEETLVNKLSANSRIKGEITFGRDLRDAGYNVTMTNDMRAACQAAARFGEGKGLENVLVATYSSGYNCAVVRNGQNASTAEFGHMAYYPINQDSSGSYDKWASVLKCGCGGINHLESFVSGNGAAQMARNYMQRTFMRRHTILQLSLNDYNKKRKSEGKKTRLTMDNLSDLYIYNRIVLSITAKNVYDAYRENPNQEPQKTIKQIQVMAITDSFGRMMSAYNPLDIMVLMGSQTKDWDLLFKPAIQLYHSGMFQLPSLPKPKIVRTELPEIGVQGAAAYFLSKNS